MELEKQGGIGLVEEYEKDLLDNFDCEDLPAVNRSHDGILLREVFMPAGSYVCGHEHKTGHFNIVLSGKAVVAINDATYRVEAGHVFVSEPGVRKALKIIEDMRWITVHHNPTNTLDNEEIEREFVDKSEAYYTAMNKQLEGKRECLSE